MTTTDQTSMQWIESGGGPLVVVPKQHLARWHGIEVPPDGDTTDYDRACAVLDYLGVLRSAQVEVLVLGDEPLPTTWLPASDGGVLVRWVYAEDESCVVAAMVQLQRGTVPPQDGGISFSVPGPCLLFDSAEPGRDVRGDSLTLDLRPGTYTVTSTQIDPSPDLRLLIHRLRLVEGPKEISPKARGGNNTLDNAQNTCRDCNLSKGKKTTREFQQRRQ